MFIIVGTQAHNLDLAESISLLETDLQVYFADRQIRIPLTLETAATAGVNFENFIDFLVNLNSEGDYPSINLEALADEWRTELRQLEAQIN